VVFLLYWLFVIWFLRNLISFLFKYKSFTLACMVELICALYLAWSQTVYKLSYNTQYSPLSWYRPWYYCCCIVWEHVVCSVEDCFYLFIHCSLVRVQSRWISIFTESDSISIYIVWVHVVYSTEACLQCSPRHGTDPDHGAVEDYAGVWF
jgi:hypothetical protein